MKKVLFLTYYYPPTGGAGVQRNLKFTKFLPKFNWQPLVVAPKWVAEEAKDESLLLEIPKEAKIWRTFIIEPRAWPLLKKFWKKEILKEVKSESKKTSLFKKIINFLRDLFFIPDDSCLWLPFLVWRGFWIGKKENPKIIFASAPPYTVLIAGIILKKLLKIPLVIDFRDPWSNLPEAHLYRKIPSWRKEIDFKLEKRVLKEADKIIVVSQTMADYFIETQKTNPSKIKIITNGFDEDDFRGIEKISSSKFTIAYAGSFYGGYNPFNFLETLGKFLEKNPKSSSVLKIRFIGRFAPGIKKTCLKYLKNTQILIDFPGYLSHQDSLSSLLNSTILLLVIGKGEGSEAVYTGKIFEYIRSGVPILALVPQEGVAAELIRKTKTGIVVDPEDAVEIEKAIEFLYRKWQKGEKVTEPVLKEIQKFERKKLTSKLAEVFNEIIT